MKNVSLIFNFTYRHQRTSHPENYKYIYLIPGPFILALFQVKLNKVHMTIYDMIGYKIMFTHIPNVVRNSYIQKL